MLQDIFQVLQSGDAPRAEALTRSLLAPNPDAEEPLLLLAFCLDAQSRSAETLAVFERLTQLYPNTSTHWSNLGAARRDLGQKAGAREAFLKAHALDSTDPTALLNLGNVAFEDGAFAQARGQLLDALQAEPNDPIIRIQAANACYECGEFDQAERLIGNWQAWATHDPLSLNEVGWLLTRLGRADQAGEALHGSAKLDPDHPRIQMRLAAFYERTNRVDEANAMLARMDMAAITREGLVTDLASIRASLASRGSDLVRAIALHEPLLADPAVIRRDPQLLSQLARLHDRNSDPAAAMRSLAEGRKVQIDQLRDRVPYLFEGDADPIGIVRRRVTPEQRADWKTIDAPSATDSPVFVVGFPRSGTTMLETMLDAHPGLAGMDERVFVQDAIEEIKQRGLAYPEQLGEIDSAFAVELRANYFKRAAERVQRASGVRLVDKNPLNIMRLPFIARLFPNAKIILALRHPCDVVLSNYMQTFRSPEYIKLCETIESTAIGYAGTFSFWIDQAELLKPDVLELRYEDVVDDIDAQSRRIADFIGIDWDRRMVDFHDHARERGFIATPSYHQVVEPLNRKGVGRWERYREYLEPAIPHLQPYLDRWNYEV
ncbi:MAG: sulfotransferase [Dokdonella sp.]